MTVTPRTNLDLQNSRTRNILTKVQTINSWNWASDTSKCMVCNLGHIQAYSKITDSLLHKHHSLLHWHASDIHSLLLETFRATPDINHLLWKTFSIFATFISLTIKFIIITTTDQLLRLLGSMFLRAAKRNILNWM